MTKRPRDTEDDLPPAKRARGESRRALLMADPTLHDPEKTILETIQANICSKEDFIWEAFLRDIMIELLERVVAVSRALDVTIPSNAIDVCWGERVHLGIPEIDYPNILFRGLDGTRIKFNFFVPHPRRKYHAIGTSEWATFDLFFSDRLAMDRNRRKKATCIVHAIVNAVIRPLYGDDGMTSGKWKQLTYPGEPVIKTSPALPWIWKPLLSDFRVPQCGQCGNQWECMFLQDEEDDI